MKMKLKLPKHTSLLCYDTFCRRDKRLTWKLKGGKKRTSGYFSYFGYGRIYFGRRHHPLTKSERVRAFNIRRHKERRFHVEFRLT